MNHPLLRELRDTYLAPGDSPWVEAHLTDCLACRVRLARLRQAGDLASPTPNVVQRIVDASTVIPGVAKVPMDRDSDEPKAGELWRVGRIEVLLVWVRRNLHDGAVDVIPVVLDVELADDQTVIVQPDAGPLPVALGAMVALRTHVHRDAFINRMGTLDIAGDVEDVIAAARIGIETTATVGPRLEHDGDERFEYRQALRDLLDELTPSNWPEDSAPADGAEDSSAAVQEQIQVRIRAAQCVPLPFDQFALAHDRALRPLFKVAYLNTAVVVAAVDALAEAMADERGLVRACQSAMESSPDADAVCITEPQANWPSVLYSSASMRDALELPSGHPVGPTPILDGYGVVDTLSKHLEGAAPAWEVADRASGSLDSIDLSEMASRHTQTSIAGIQAQGRRAVQQPKKTTWSSLSPELEDRVSRFVTAVIGSIPVAEALNKLTQAYPDA